MPASNCSHTSLPSSAPYLLSASLTYGPVQFSGDTTHIAALAHQRITSPCYVLSCLSRGEWKEQILEGRGEMKLIFVDVEATGRSPINGTMTEFGAVDYKTRQSFHGVVWESRPVKDNPSVSVITGKQIAPLEDVMMSFMRWLEGLGKDRPIFVSDNP